VIVEIGQRGNPPVQEQKRDHRVGDDLGYGMVGVHGGALGGWDSETPRDAEWIGRPGPANSIRPNGAGC
jgi:hypothetical protein